MSPVTSAPIRSKDKHRDVIELADVAHVELDAVGGQTRVVLGVTGVDQLVEVDDVHPEVLANDMVDEA